MNDLIKLKNKLIHLNVIKESKINNHARSIITNNALENDIHEVIKLDIDLIEKIKYINAEQTTLNVCECGVVLALPKINCFKCAHKNKIYVKPKYMKLTAKPHYSLFECQEYNYNGNFSGNSVKHEWQHRKFFESILFHYKEMKIYTTNFLIIKQFITGELAYNLCENCEHPTKSNKQLFCSTKCSNVYNGKFVTDHNKITQSKIKSNLVKYGVQHTSQVPEIAAKMSKGLKLYHANIDEDTRIKTNNKISISNREYYKNNPDAAMLRSKQIDYIANAIKISNTWKLKSDKDHQYIQAKRIKTCKAKFNHHNVFGSEYFYNLMTQRHGVQYIFGSDFSKFTNYTRMVWVHTNESYKNKKEIINPNNLQRAMFEYHLDHKISILVGFKNKLSPKFIGSYHNLQMLPARENVSKKTNCYSALEFNEAYRESNSHFKLSSLSISEKS